MCRAQSDPRGPYRCTWGTQPGHLNAAAQSAAAQSAVAAPVAASRLEDTLAKAAGAALAGGSSRFPGSPQAMWDEAVTAAIADIGVSADEAISGDPDALADMRTALGSGGALLSGQHLVCGLAALIGAVCATLPSGTNQLADAVGDEVARRTGSRVAGAAARAATKRVIAGVTRSLGVPDPGTVGLVADAAAVVACPRLGGHDEVRESDKRLGGKAAELFVTTTLTDLAADRPPLSDPSEATRS